MRYSALFGKTIKDAPKDAVLISHKLLHKAGFIRESTAGRYYFLPLGLRVQQKIQKIIKEEMDASGAQEILTPILHPIELWKETNRTKSVGFELMVIRDRNKTEFVLGGTAEEMIVELARKFQVSYKDLPFNIYQFSTKFRDELRARGGLLRLREFVMKDAYSFHATEEDFKKEYEKMTKAYLRIFEKMGLKAIKTESDNGYIGGEYSHEFQVVCKSGEDEIVYCSGGDFSQNAEISEVAAGKACDLGHGPLEKVKSVEVGNIFQLGYHYSSKMKDAVFTDQNGSKKPFYMGCYGIGLARTLATIVEVHHDEKGIVWPKEVAPYGVHLIMIKDEGLRIKEKADKICEDLEKAGVEVSYDDREDVTPGAKFADADLIGIPVRLVVSKRTLQQGSGQAGDKIEFKG
ncbi:MAG: proline--tRNA ligase, partial [Candidatus Berkelbacteria bacterium]|nr:proline--tRNA ligase [Candidatus Berkelbacteria bacterium]